MRVLTPTYTLHVEVRDPMQQPSVQGAGSMPPPRANKFWNGATSATGCDDVVKQVHASLTAAGLDCTVMLDRFEHK